MAKIFCPKCQWKPRSSDLWVCIPGCGREWHTFDTRGQCPSCGKQWQETACFRCNQWSWHEAWYHDDGSNQSLERLFQAEPVAEEIDSF